jgi:hypothetical protein
MKYIILLLGLLFVSCGNSVANSELPTITPTPEGKKIVSESSDWKVRISYTEEILQRVREISSATRNSALMESSKILQSCSILAPREDELVVIKAKDENCFIVPLLRNETSSMASLLMEDPAGKGGFAYYKVEFKTVVIKPYEANLDFLALVLLHEGIHVIDNQPCNPGESRCRALNEALAYVSQSFILDYLGTSKSSRYQEYLDQQAREALEAYLENKKIIPPDYEKASEMREFFDSNSKKQDDLWYSSFYLRKYLQMFLILHEGDFLKAQLSYVDFLEALIVNGVL